MVVTKQKCMLITVRPMCERGLPSRDRYKFALYGATKSYGHILSSGIEECYGDQGQDSIEKVSA